MCLHFATRNGCSRDTACPYIHVKLAKDAPICIPFARHGYCQVGGRNCSSVHLFYCPEFWIKGGVCRLGGGAGGTGGRGGRGRSAGGKCLLHHVRMEDFFNRKKGVSGSCVGNTTTSATEFSTTTPTKLRQHHRQDQNQQDQDQKQEEEEEEELMELQIRPDFNGDLEEEEGDDEDDDEEDISDAELDDDDEFIEIGDDAEFSADEDGEGDEAYFAEAINFE